LSEGPLGNLQPRQPSCQQRERHDIVKLAVSRARMLGDGVVDVVEVSLIGVVGMLLRYPGRLGCHKRP
jgi:hypothetical protein